MSAVLGLNPDSLTVLLVHWALTTALVLEWNAVNPSALASRGTSDFKEVLLIVQVVWRSATTMSGVQCVMTPGADLMLK